MVTSLVAQAGTIVVHWASVDVRNMSTVRHVRIRRFNRCLLCLREIMQRLCLLLDLHQRTKFWNIVYQLLYPLAPERQLLVAGVT